MSNYPNMSYCMCENTLRALRQVQDAMREYDTFDEFMEDMNREEKAAFKVLLDVCDEISVMREEMNYA